MGGTTLTIGKSVVFRVDRDSTPFPMVKACHPNSQISQPWAVEWASGFRQPRCRPFEFARPLSLDNPMKRDLITLSVMVFILSAGPTSYAAEPALPDLTTDIE